MPPRRHSRVPKRSEGDTVQAPTALRKPRHQPGCLRERELTGDDPKVLPGLGHARTGGGLVFPLTKVEWSHSAGPSELSIIRQGSITRARPSGRSSPGPEGSKGAPWGH